MMKRIACLLAAMMLLCLPALAEETQTSEGTDATDTRIDTNMNEYPVKSGPKSGAVIGVDEDEDPLEILKIRSYHWNDGAGTEEVGEILIFRCEEIDGKWKPVGDAVTFPATGESVDGRPNIFWVCYPNFIFEPGVRYLIRPSDISTWSYNEESKNRGFLELTVRDLTGEETLEEARAETGEDEEWTCPECGNDGNKGNFCINCGEKKPVEEWICPACGAFENKGNFCINCGAKRPE